MNPEAYRHLRALATLPYTQRAFQDDDILVDFSTSEGDAGITWGELRAVSSDVRTLLEHTIHEARNGLSKILWKADLEGGDVDQSGVEQIRNTIGMLEKYLVDSGCYERKT